MIKVLFNIITSEVDHVTRCRRFKDWGPDGKLDYENNPNAYLEYELFAIQEVVDWCHEQKLNFDVTRAYYAMQVYFIFKNECDAMAFKLRWI